MGLFDRFRKRNDSSKEEPPPEPEPVATPVLVAVARHGMSQPPADYVEAVLAVDCTGGLADGVIRVALSQPRWPASADLMDSSVAALARALARQHGIEAASSSYLESKGPDGAEVLIVTLYA